MKFSLEKFKSAEFRKALFTVIRSIASKDKTD